MVVAAGDVATGQRSAPKADLQEGTQTARPWTNPRSRWLGEKWERPKEVLEERFSDFRREENGKNLWAREFHRNQM